MCWGSGLVHSSLFPLPIVYFLCVCTTTQQVGLSELNDFEEFFHHVRSKEQSQVVGMTARLLLLIHLARAGLLVYVPWRLWTIFLVTMVLYRAGLIT